MNLSDYVERLGFQTNPFQHTNADKEVDYIEKYFISPDYFEDVWGDIYNPVSNIVYAPRGAGKTAQRIMIEKRAFKTNNVVAISYINHDFSNIRSIQEINLNYHLTYLNRLLLLSFFSRLNNLPHFKYVHIFDFSERQYIYKLVKNYLYETPISFPKQALNSLKTLPDKACEVWNNFKEPITNIISQISKKQGVEVDISSLNVDENLKSSHRENFLNLVNLINRVGIDAIYFLIDKVDETTLTGNNPKDSYQLIADLIKDLELLETDNVGFKFFIWDALKPMCIEQARPDRVFSYELIWTEKSILQMLDKRVKTFSEGKVKKFVSLFDDKRSVGRIVLMGQLSPRDCIRICQRALSEQFKDNEYADRISLESVNKAIYMFAHEKSKELIHNSSNLRHLTKTNSVCFTIEELVTRKVGSDSAAIRNIINPWTKAEYLKKIGIVPRKNKKAVNEYAFQDLRLAFVAQPTIDINDFFKNKIRRCKESTCKRFYFRDFERKTYECPYCNTEN